PPATPECPPVSAPPCSGITFGGMSSGFVLTFLPGPSGYGSATVGFTGNTNPKYEVVSVYYAPPGSHSYVNYNQTTMVGKSTTYNNSFTSQVSKSVTLAARGENRFG